MTDRLLLWLSIFVAQFVQNRSLFRGSLGVNCYRFSLLAFDLLELLCEIPTVICLGYDHT